MNGENLKYNYNVITMVFTGTEVDQELRYKGELIYYHTGTITLNVKLGSQSEDAIPLTAKEQITAPFSRLFFTPSGAGSVILYLANPKEVKIESKQVNVDSVNNVVRDDSFRYYTDQQKAFFGWCACGALASNYSHAQLKNPSGSGVSIYLSKVTITLTAISDVFVRRYDTDLSTPQNAMNRDLASASGYGLCKVEQYTSLYGSNLARLYVSPAGVLCLYEFSNPFKIDPGEGFVLVPSIVNDGIYANFEWVEVPVP